MNKTKGPDNPDNPTCHMSTSSNQSQKKSEDWIGKAGRRKEMVEDRSSESSV